MSEQEQRQIKCSACGDVFVWEGVFVHENCIPKKCGVCQKRQGKAYRVGKAFKACKHCGNGISRDNHGQVAYCSDECRAAAKAKRKAAVYKAERPKRWCVQCQSEVTGSGQAKLCAPCKTEMRNAGLDKACGDCGNVYKARSLTSKRCRKCVKLKVRSTLKRLGREKAATYGNVAQQNGAACESLFKYYCDLNGIPSYWPMIGTNASVDCVIDIDGRLYRVQVKANRDYRTSDGFYFCWANREKMIQPDSCDLVACVDMAMQAFVVVPCEYAANHYGKAFVAPEIITIERGDNSDVERCAFALMISGVGKK